MFGPSAPMATAPTAAVARPPSPRPQTSSRPPPRCTAPRSPGRVGQTDVVDIEPVEMGRRRLPTGPASLSVPSPRHEQARRYQPARAPRTKRRSWSRPPQRKADHPAGAGHADVAAIGDPGHRLVLTGSFALPWSCCLAAPRQKGGTAPGACNGGSVPRSLRSLLYSPSLRANRCIPP